MLASATANYYILEDLLTAFLSDISILVAHFRAQPATKRGKQPLQPKAGNKKAGGKISMPLNGFIRWTYTERISSKVNRDGKADSNLTATKPRTEIWDQALHKGPPTAAVRLPLFWVAQ